MRINDNMNKMNKPFSKKITIIILIALALLTTGMAYGLLVLSQKDELNWDTLVNHKQPVVYEELKTEMDTSGWVRYENKDYGISFRYPKNWEVREMLGELAIRPKNCPEFYTGYGDDHTWGTAITIYEPLLTSETTLPESVFDGITKEENRIDAYQKVGDYKIHKISYISNNDKKQRTVAMVLYKDIVIETRTMASCISVVDEPEFLDAILTTLKIYK